ncbi:MULTISPECIES: ATP-binding protein [unclassified Amycolatopsis]|uniref:ATP-binding protein n=1 Tax=unclassified Amycolatopsis TaxID=2618356 RepID=UPI001FF6F68C|nr:ATP-binding protein [Amycolatopsis sp. FBCC-B4732]UOX90309.1 ATP-binding protein [Amycolatopsis sp. FBCC-B4732]
MSAHTSQMDDIRLVAQPSALPVTELFVRLILTDWSLRPMLEQTTAAARRLVEAVIEAGNPKAPSFVTLRLRLTAEVLVVEVDDDVPGLPEPKAGPGERVGVEHGVGGARTTWCELALPGGMSARQVRLPRRQDRRTLVDEPVSGDPVAADPQVLERLLTRLSGWSADG